jgi:rubrerythrin
MTFDEWYRQSPTRLTGPGPDTYHQCRDCGHQFVATDERMCPRCHAKPTPFPTSGQQEKP